MNKPEISGDSIVIPSSTDFLADAVAFVEERLREFGADESAVADIALSTSEIVNNAISHGNAADRSKKVTIRVTRNKQDVSVSVIDQGTGFIRSDIDDPLADENLLKEAGRGIFIVEHLMDKIDIIPTGNGTTITITKAL